MGDLSWEARHRRLIAIVAQAPERRSRFRTASHPRSFGAVSGRDAELPCAVNKHRTMTESGILFGESARGQQRVGSAG